MATGEQVIRTLWRCFDERRFADVRELLADDFVAEWPQTRERIRGPDNFIALNANYPGAWRCRVAYLEVTAAGFVSVVEISDASHRLYAVSFYRLAGDRIQQVTEYFGDAGEPPFERGQWAERT